MDLNELKALRRQRRLNVLGWLFAGFLFASGAVVGYVIHSFIK